MSKNFETTVTNQPKSFYQIVSIPNEPVPTDSSRLLNNENSVVLIQPHSQPKSLPQDLPTYEATGPPMEMGPESSSLLGNENSVVSTQPQFQPPSLPHIQPPYDQAAAPPAEAAQIELLQEQVEHLKEKQRQMQEDREIERCCFVCDEMVDGSFCWMFCINYCCRPIGLFCQCIGECTESCCEGCGECITGCCESGSGGGEAVDDGGSSGDCGDCDCSCCDV